MSRTIGLALAALVLAACGGGGGGGGGGDDHQQDQQKPPIARGFVSGAGNPSAPGGHRIVGGVLGGGGEAKSAQHVAKGGLLP